MARKTCILRIAVEYDSARTDPEALAAAFDRLLGTALSTPGILDAFGHVEVGGVLPGLGVD